MKQQPSKTDGLEKQRLGDLTIIPKLQRMIRETRSRVADLYAKLGFDPR